MYYHSYNRPLHAYLSAKPSQSWLRLNSKHTITSTYDARTLVLFNSKIIHPKQSDSNTSSSIQQPHFYHLRHGIPYPKQWVQQRWLAESLMRDKLYTKSTASVRPQELWWNGKDTYYNKPTLDFNHMLIYNLYDILSFEYQPSGLKVYNIIMLTQNINMPFGVARTSVLLGLQGILA